MTAQGFPLALTPFERYMVLDDRPDHPMIFLAVIDFDGVFEKDLLERAVTMALERHPMLRSTVRGRREWREPSPANALDVIRWLPWSDEMPGEAFARIDIGRENGVRFFIQQTADRTRWTLEFHHAAADGKGLLSFFRDVVAAYAAVVAGGACAEPQWQASDPGLLRRRGTSERTTPAGAPSAPGASDVPAFRDVMAFLFRRPALVRPVGAPREPSRAGAAPPLVHHTFAASDVDRIRRTARAHDASVNDVFLCAAFQTLADWNEPGVPRRSGWWLRVMVPTDLRTRADVGMGAANVLGYGFLDRRTRDCGDTSALLRSVHEEMRSVRLNRLGRQILHGIAVVDRVPGLLGVMLRRPSTLATVVFSNVGRVDARLPVTPEREPEAGGAGHPRMRQLLGVVPLRAGTRAGFLLSQLRDTLTLTLRTDPRYLDREAAEALLAALVGKVNDICRHDPLS